MIAAWQPGSIGPSLDVDCAAKKEIAAAELLKAVTLSIAFSKGIVFRTVVVAFMRAWTATSLKGGSELVRIV